MTKPAVRPVRLQLSRTKGFHLQSLSLATNGLPAAKVTRPGKWGNPVVVDRVRSFRQYDLRQGAGRVPSNGAHVSVLAGDRADRAVAVLLFRSFAEAFREVEPAGFREWIAPLSGKNLACSCALDQPCHADVLLEIANA